MISSLVCAENILKKYPTIVSYSDIYYEQSAVSKLINCGTDIAICYYSKWKGLWKERFGNPLVDAETFKINKNSYLTNVVNDKVVEKELPRIDVNG